MYTKNRLMKDDLVAELGNLNKVEFGYEFKKQVLRHYQMHLTKLKFSSLKTNPNCLYREWTRMCLGQHVTCQTQI